MELGLPLLLITVLSTVVLVAWLFGGPGLKKVRRLVAGLFLLPIALAWLALLNFGAFHPVGSWGLLLGFIFAVTGLFVPIIFRKVYDNRST